MSESKKTEVCYNRKKIGGVIVVHPNHNNYGTSLQGFATVKIIEKAGYDLRIIRYKKKRTLNELIETVPGLLKSGALKVMLKRILVRHCSKWLHRDYFVKNRIRTEAVNKFKAKYFDTLSDYYCGYTNLHEGSKKYNVIFVGSDQVWGPLSLYSKFYNLLFVDNSIPKFSYASSFGVSDILPWQKDGTSNYLKRLDKIGVREQRGKEIVEELTGRDDVKVVLDPTFLLTREEWEKNIDESRCKIDVPYILCYVLGERKDIRNTISELSKKTGLKIVNLPHVDRYHAMDDKLGDINLYDVDPFDFIRLIRDAKYVVTDSFHGSVFSILFHKKFMTFYRANPNKKNSTHSRINSLFAVLGINKEHIYTGGDISVLINSPVDWQKVGQNLEKLRQESIGFLKSAIESVK